MHTTTERIAEMFDYAVRNRLVRPGEVLALMETLSELSRNFSKDASDCLEQAVGIEDEEMAEDLNRFARLAEELGTDIGVKIVGVTS